MNKTEKTTQLEQFRKQVYQNFNKRADTLMELMDALSSHRNAKSVVELSLDACFRRGHDSIFQGIAEWKWETDHLAEMAAEYLPKPRQYPFWLFGVDVTSQKRVYAHTAEDRGFVYQPQVIKGNKPITIGHQYSTVVMLPEKEDEHGVPWVVPLSNQRVRTDQDKAMVGAGQIRQLLSNTKLPFHGELCVEVGDTDYSKPAYLAANRHHQNLVTISRSRSNRTYYRQPTPESHNLSSGHPTWYGDPFALPDPQTWHEPDDAIIMMHTSRRGRTYQVVIQSWQNMLMRGKRKPYPIPMHNYPFTLVRIVLYDEHGKTVFKRPLWLLVVGDQRHNLDLVDLFLAYTQRFDIEHFFRFGKQRLLLASFQTPITDHEEAWWPLAHFTSG